MKLHPIEIQLRKNIYEAFECLHNLGFRRRRFRATAHEYEIWYYDSTQGRAVRLTIERQWEYKYLFVLFSERDLQNDRWVPLCYFDNWLKRHGWAQSEIDAIFKSELPVQNMSDEEQLVFLSKTANMLCEWISEVFEREGPGKET